MVEAARADLESRLKRAWPTRLVRGFIFRHLLPSRRLLGLAGGALLLYQRFGLQALVRATRLLKPFGRLDQVERLAPTAQWPFFFRCFGSTFPAEAPQRFRVAFLAGCIANLVFARLNEATVRVLRKNGCEVVVPSGQSCCGALHVHAGMRKEARELARRNIDAFLGGGFDAIITNAAGCGSTLKEYHDLLEDDPRYAGRARRFAAEVKDVNEFLASIPLNPNLGPLAATVTYQDSCHLAHGQKITQAPRRLLAAIPGLQFREMISPDLCCGSAGVYNVVQNEMAMALLARKMAAVNRTGASLIATANPGCMLQLEAGVRMHGNGQRVAHVVELLDQAYRNWQAQTDQRKT
jgi:glycolate oxidase iron-sulfur subunit